MRNVLINDINNDVRDILRKRFGETYYVMMDDLDIHIGVDGWDRITIRMIIPNLGMRAHGLLVEGENDVPVKVYPKSKATTPEQFGFRDGMNK